MKTPLEAAVGFWNNQREFRALRKRARKQYWEWGEADMRAFDLGYKFKKEEVPVLDQLAAVATVGAIAEDERHHYCANALHTQATHLDKAADQAYAEGWPQEKVEEFRSASRAKNEKAFELAGHKRSFLTEKGWLELDGRFEGSAHVQGSSAYSLVWQYLEQGQTDQAFLWYGRAKDSTSGDELTLNDLNRLMDAINAAAFFGPGMPQSPGPSNVVGLPWQPAGLRDLSLGNVVYAEVTSFDSDKIGLRVWRWPQLDRQSRLQWTEAKDDWHWVDVETMSFMAAAGKFRPTSLSVLALKLKDKFPVYEPNRRFDQAYDFDEMFEEVVADITKEVRAQCLETIRSVGRDQLSA